ncbi:unnamed protein product [Mytilus coruscus]|uniref:Uncharacterized protein n=1 Tax=Mytilus coruscus TaxID=42192 RepID=A0A6J8B8E8_MYTCO|nr:unnamed protein product [Mytilus coruscus]
MILLLPIIFVSCHGFLLDTSTPAGNGFCSFPCKLQDKLFYNEAANDTVITPNPYTLELASQQNDKITCLERSGAFILNRRGTKNDVYRCIKIIDVCDDAIVVLQTDLFTLTTPPKLCEICTPDKLRSQPELWVVIKCNVPSTCSTTSVTDQKCDGSESNIPDNGHNCKTQG